MAQSVKDHTGKTWSFPDGMSTEGMASVIDEYYAKQPTPKQTASNGQESAENMMGRHARNILEGVGDFPALFLNPVVNGYTYLTNKITGRQFPMVEMNPGTWLANAANLPQGNGVDDLAMRGMAGSVIPVGLASKAAKAGAEAARPTLQKAIEWLGSHPVGQLFQGAGSSVAGGKTREFLNPDENPWTANIGGALAALLGGVAGNAVPAAWHLGRGGARLAKEQIDVMRSKDNPTPAVQQRTARVVYNNDPDKIEQDVQAIQSFKPRYPGDAPLAAEITMNPAMINMSQSAQEKGFQAQSFVKKHRLEQEKLQDDLTRPIAENAEQSLGTYEKNTQQQLDDLTRQRQDTINQMTEDAARDEIKRNQFLADWRTGASNAFTGRKRKALDVLRNERREAVNAFQDIYNNALKKEGDQFTPLDETEYDQGTRVRGGLKQASDQGKRDVSSKYDSIWADGDSIHNPYDVYRVLDEELGDKNPLKVPNRPDTPFTRTLNELSSKVTHGETLTGQQILDLIQELKRIGRGADVFNDKGAYGKQVNDAAERLYKEVLFSPASPMGDIKPGSKLWNMILQEVKQDFDDNPAFNDMRYVTTAGWDKKAFISAFGDALVKDLVKKHPRMLADPPRTKMDAASELDLGRIFGVTDGTVVNEGDWVQKLYDHAINFDKKRRSHINREMQDRIDTIRKGFTVDMTPEQQARLKDAREASNEQHDTFVNGPVGSILAPGKNTHGYKMAPDEVMKTGLTDNGMRAINRAAANDPFLDQILYSEFASRLDENARKAIVDMNGRVVPEKLYAFLNTHGDLAKHFETLFKKYNGILERAKTAKDNLDYNLNDVEDKYQANVDTLSDAFRDRNTRLNNYFNERVARNKQIKKDQEMAIHKKGEQLDRQRNDVARQRADELAEMKRSFDTVYGRKSDRYYVKHNADLTNGQHSNIIPAQDRPTIEGVWKAKQNQEAYDKTATSVGRGADWSGKNDYWNLASAQKYIPGLGRIIRGYNERAVYPFFDEVARLQKNPQEYARVMGEYAKTIRNRNNPWKLPQYFNPRMAGIIQALRMLTTPVSEDDIKKRYSNY